MRRPAFLTALLLAGPALAADPAPEPPDAEFLEFLGETAGEDEDFVRFMESVEAERALKRAEEESPKEDDDE
jgi:hypothetical protein